jgi:hypothetical protein
MESVKELTLRIGVALPVSLGRRKISRQDAETPRKEEVIIFLIFLRLGVFA